MSKEIDGTEYACLTINAFLEEENKELKQRIAELEEQLKNAIVPRFKVGQEVYIVRDRKIGKEQISNIGIWEKSITYDMNLDYKYRTLQCMAVYVDENDIFATEEEAQERLKDYEKI